MGANKHKKATTHSWFYGKNPLFTPEQQAGEESLMASPSGLSPTASVQLLGEHVERVTIGDLMAMLLDLHPQHLARTGVTSIKKLRLVNKQINRQASAAIKSCTVNLSEECPQSCTRHPSPKNLVVFLAGSQLKHLNVEVRVRSGAENPVVVGSTLSAQMQCLQAEFRQALAGVTFLRLSLLICNIGMGMQFCSASARPTGDNKQCQQQQQQQPASNNNKCPPHSNNHRYHTSQIVNKLSELLPSLHHLDIDRCDWVCEVLPDFGLTCPNLDSLTIDASYVLVKRISDFGKHLPKLAKVTLHADRDDEDNALLLNTFMGSFLPMTRHCPNLRSLKLTFGQSWEAGYPHQRSYRLDCGQGAWDHVPHSLQKLSCSCEVQTSQSFRGLLSQIPRLSLQQSPSDNLTDFVYQCPSLQRLSVRGEQMMYVNCGGSVYNRTAMSDLKQRLLASTLSVKCDSIGFSGTSAAILEVLKWLTRFKCRNELCMTLNGDASNLCLQQIGRLFPYVHTLDLDGTYDAHGLVWNSDVSKSLAALSCLYTLRLRGPFYQLARDDPAELCKHLPCFLEELVLDHQLYPSVAHTLRAEMRRLGRSTSVQVFNPDD